MQVPLQLSFVDAVRGVERTVGDRHAGGSSRTRVRVPAGVKDGATIKVRGKGEPSPQGGPAGDLLLKVSVSKHPRLRRRGNDLIAELPVTVYDAILGAKVQVPTLDGTATINLPRGTRSGQTFRLQGRGVPAAGGTAGDLLARVRVQTPREVSDDVAELMHRFRDAHPYEPE